jgi:hypothetical protein
LQGIFGLRQVLAKVNGREIIKIPEIVIKILLISCQTVASIIIRLRPRAIIAKPAIDSVWAVTEHLMGGKPAYSHTGNI